jgi:hypothetical protein
MNAMQSLLATADTLNILLDAETQLKAAASPRRSCSGQRRR